MKKLFVLIVACFFAFISIQAQSSDVEVSTQLSKVEQFKMKCSFIKEAQIYQYNGLSIKIYTKLFTNLETGENTVALEFWQPNVTKLVGTPAPLGYLDLDQVDDLLRALEMILTESNNASKKEQFVISYTAPGGIDVFYTDGKTNSSRFVIFRKKWYSVDDYGLLTTNYSQSMILLGIKELPNVISSIKEAQLVGKQIFEK